MPGHAEKVIRDFGDEWTTYSQDEVPAEELRSSFDDYFRIIDLKALPPDCIAADIGCGSGRWAKLFHPHVATLYCLEPSSAIEVAKRNLASAHNIVFVRSELESMPIPDGSLDFIYCLGVLHHLPDTQAGINACASKLKAGGRMLAYIYYSLENQPFWFRALWHASSAIRLLVCRLPHRMKIAATVLIAGLVYYPLSQASKLIERLGANVTNFPLSYYRHKSFYTMKTDALDRFGTSLERRFTQQEIRTMLTKAGFEDITFSSGKPYWCVTGVKSPQPL